MRVSPKFLADLLTASRGVAALAVFGAALQADPATLPWVVAGVVAAWSGDMVDGWLARQGGESPLDWIGKHDHPVDVSLATATLVYLWRIELIPEFLLALLLAGALFIWFRVRSEWVWLGFNTGSHLVALSALANTFPALASVVVGSGAIVVLAGRHRAARMLDELRVQFSRFRRRSGSG